MDYETKIKEYLALEGEGSRVMLDYSAGWRTPPQPKLCKVDSFVSSAYLPWSAIKHLHPTPDKPCYTDMKKITDINNPEKYRWVGTKPNPDNDAKYGRAMFCLKTGTLRTQTMGEFYETSEVD